MAIDPYASCPCGSGKKFKWCCQAIHGQIEQAFMQANQGQHEVALRTLDAVIAANPNNPEPLGRKAQLLFMQGRSDEAEEALDKSFELNPNYPFGHYLRARVRLEEGEIRGALLLFRKAAQHYDASAHGTLAMLYASICECEMRLNRPVASRMAIRLAIKHDSSISEFHKMEQGLFGKEAQLPPVAKQEYHYKTVPAGTPKKEKAAWQQALLAQTTGKFDSPLKTFEGVTAKDPKNAAAWYNLALTWAWLGQNAEALKALGKYVELETDETEAAKAWGLGEVLRCGPGLEKTLADHVEHSRIYEFRDGQRVGKLLDQLSAEGRLIGSQMDEEQGMFRAVLVEKQTSLVGSTEHPPSRFVAFVLILGSAFRLSSTCEDRLLRAALELEQMGGGIFGRSISEVGPARFGEILFEALTFPPGQDDKIVMSQISEEMGKYFEQTWIHQPRRALDNKPPVDARGDAVLRKKLLGVILFLEECAKSQGYSYDFDKLRNQLNLFEKPPPSSQVGGVVREVASMNADQLQALVIADLSDEELELAAQTAKRVSAQDLSIEFLEGLVARPPNAEKPDRFNWYKQLIEFNIRSGQLDVALDHVNDGEKHDCENNEGRRRNDFEFWRGKVHSKRGEYQEAHDVFERLIERVPSDLSYRGAATEAMLAAKQGDQALKFAQGGLDEARKQQDPDNEGYFMELTEAAQKLAGK
ncbi:MAG: tetratricopeptide repeat protein [Gemmataceae bacterium]